MILVDKIKNNMATLTLKSFLNSINTLIDKYTNKPTETIPAILIYAGSINRPGLSAYNVASKIIYRQTEAGAPYGDAADGSPNIAEAMERIRVEEMIHAIKYDSRVQVALPIGSIKFMGTGANAGGPVVVNGFNVNVAHGDGIIS